MLNELSKKERKEIFLKNILVKEFNEKRVIQFYFSQNLLSVYSKELIANYKDIYKLLKTYKVISNQIVNEKIKELEDCNQVQIEVIENNKHIEDLNNLLENINSDIFEAIKNSQVKLLFNNKNFMTIELSNSENVDAYLEKIMNVVYSILDTYFLKIVYVENIYELELYFRNKELNDKKRSCIKFSLTKNKAKISMSNKNNVLDSIILKNTLNRLNFMTESYNDRFVKNKINHIVNITKNKNNIFTELNRALYLGLMNKTL